MNLDLTQPVEDLNFNETGPIPRGFNDTNLQLGSAQEDEQDVEEMTFPGYDAESLLERTFLKKPVDTGINSNVSGNKIATWGTGYQGGLKLCFQNETKEAKDSDSQVNPLFSQDDKCTNATTVADQLTQVSGVPSSKLH